MKAARRLWPILFLAVCAILPLWRAIFQGQVIGPFDQIRHMAPWNGPSPERPWDVLQADAVLQFYPWRDMVFQSWGKGQLPAWNPYELAGTPLLANSQSAALYPPHILIGLLHVPTALAITLLAWFHLFWAGLGVFYLTRKLGASKMASATAGAAFALSPFMVSWVGLASVITTVAWIPWVLALIIAQFNGWAACEEEMRVKEGIKLFPRSIALSVCFAMMFLGGHLQFCAYGTAAAVVFFLWLAFTHPWPRRLNRPSMELVTLPDGAQEAQPISLERKRKTNRVRNRWFEFFCVVLPLVLGGFLAAPQLLPVLNYGHFSHRANTPTATGYDAYVKGSIPVLALQGLAFPTALGNPAQPSPAIKDVNAYWPQLTNVGMDFAESALGLGPLVFLLLFFGAKPKRASAALVLIGALALLAALGSFVNWPIYYLVPGWSATGSPGRASVLFVLAACVLAGLAVGNLKEVSRKTVSVIAAGACILGLIFAFFAFYVTYSSPLGTTEQINTAIRATVSGQAPVILATLFIALVAIGAYRYNAKYAWALPTGVLAVAFVAYGKDLVPTSNSTLPSIQTDTGQRYAFINKGWGLWSPSHALMPPNTASYSRTLDLGGYDSLIHRDSVGMLRAVDGEDPAAKTNGNMMLISPKANPALLSEAGVTRVWSLQPLTGFGPSRLVNGMLQYELPGNGRIFALPSGGNESVNPALPVIEEETFDSLRVRAFGHALLIDKDRLMPGWTAAIDGKPTELKPYDSPLGKGLWREVEVPAGTHEVEFHYDPPGFKTGLWLTLIPIGWFIWLGIDWRRNRIR